MNNKEALQLISFPTCPFVQRSVITANEKQIPLDLTYIDLADKPQWFLDISPLGKVPVLKVGDEVIFESAVINEFLDEYSGEPRLLPVEDLVQKARDRAWIEFAGPLNGLSYRLYAATGETELNEVISEIKDKLKILERQLGEGPFWHGETFSLVDATYAPFFMRILLSNTIKTHELWDEAVRTRKWADTLLNRESVKDSVREDFKDDLFTRFSKKDSYLINHLEQ